MLCAMKLSNVNMDRLIGSINKVVGDYVKEKGDMDDALLVISIAKVVDHEDGAEGL